MKILNKKATVLTFLVICIVIFYFVNKFESWNLLICKDPILVTGTLHCQQNEYELKGYKSQASCMEKGIELSKGKDFECGKNCHENNEGFNVCDEICNKYRGCN
ncbi:hypothetical protein A2130_01890 [Candidatus Woesebacteria bacterium GWC2_33_12]|uniref:Uncharacterized protein n=1 Tax=Candidatus Woesebacteria bacterium GW2011_GWB1_33_22 TaxID=1618566 RepID=A0A0G0CNJ7_9BACT|nr:MAG: hypothetical protein UR29_C0003G0010 [Candidatus Woesebacteria bacterium GW2011_GWC2_33_12]KKP42251.1 MAG: hypothetical protein UR33_C0004G0010 [Candidatus Woesebacteria bacterium GW2011_GWA2_33_20]KKP44982.1 MAG: hypothetical protein UR35_C0004G0014 [Candidatus Woesebacteria bacterium GW2011_GWB1_33_22]KKP46831.1 MAG: hypothetical protein UR37_C0004G0010 [Microgenomates group bacterium GW2011_GWC1_33_28]KKP50703.1 MAG: hypothetical protein UR41_C0004G0014 [Candidatus Woesebacteria bact